jgi:hypothetical protein
LRTAGLEKYGDLNIFHHYTRFAVKPQGTVRVAWGVRVSFFLLQKGGFSDKISTAK